MRTNIELNTELINEAIKLSDKKSKKEIVNYALLELVKKLKRQKLLELEGKVKWDGDLAVMREPRI